jgi:flagellum-specific peptidoglycan hydrolase FlgJ
MTREQFTKTYYPLAVIATKGTPIFPETVISAAGLESGWNTSQLSSQYNNFFGFKSSPNWNGTTVTLPTKEEINGKIVTVNAVFRSYPSATDSFKDYVRLLQTAHYVNAGVTVAKDSIAQFQALQKAGYATDSSYSSKLASVYYSIKSFFHPIPK